MDMYRNRPTSKSPHPKTHPVDSDGNPRCGAKLGDYEMKKHWTVADSRKCRHPKCAAVWATLNRRVVS
jgi:hypothetical protein